MRRASLPPLSPAAQEEAEPIVLEVAEPEAEALDVLNHQVGALGCGVGEAGAVPAQDGDFPAGDAAGEAFSLGHVAVVAVVMEGDERAAGVERVVGEVGLAQEFLLAR